MGLLDLTNAKEIYYTSKAIAKIIHKTISVWWNDTSLIVENHSNNVTYTGAWSVGEDGEHYAFGENKAVTFGFTGTQFQIYGVKDHHAGMADIVVDGLSIATMDTYSASRQPNTLMYTSPVLADGEHVVHIVTLAQLNPSATPSTGSWQYPMTFDRAVVTGSSIMSPAPEGPSPGTVTILNEDFNRVDTLTSAENADSTASPFWWVVQGFGPYSVDGTMLKYDTGTNFGRIGSKIRFGGPNKTIRIRYRARINAYNSTTWTGAQGLKFGIRYPSPNNTTYSADDPKSVFTSPGDSESTGQAKVYVAVDAMTEAGLYEIAELGYDSEPYSFITTGRPAASVPTLGQWYEKSIEIAQTDGSLKFRFWNNSDLSGTPVWEATDTTNLPLSAGYFWIRGDYINSDIDWVIVEEVDTKPYTSSITVTPTSGTTEDTFSASATFKAPLGITLEEITIAVRNNDTTDTASYDFAHYTNVTIPAGGTYTIPASSRIFSKAASYQAYVAYKQGGVWNRDKITVRDWTVSAAPTSYSPSLEINYEGTSPYGWGSNIQGYGATIVDTGDTHFPKGAHFLVDDGTRASHESDTDPVRRNEYAHGDPNFIGNPQVGTTQWWAGTTYFETGLVAQQYNSSTGGWFYFKQWHGGSGPPPLALGITNDSSPPVLFTRTESGNFSWGAVPTDRQVTIGGVVYNRVDWKMKVLFSDTSSTGRVSIWVNDVLKHDNVSAATMKAGNPNGLYLKEGGYGSRYKADGTPNVPIKLIHTGLRYGPSEGSITLPTTVAPTVLYTADGSGTATTFNHTNTKDDRDAPFYMENNTGSILDRDGVGLYRRNNTNTNFRMWSQRAVGGPGNDIRIKYRFRVNNIAGVDGGLIEGVKCLIKWVAPINPDQGPNGARGIYPWAHPSTGQDMAPGSMTYVPVTHIGYREISKRPWGATSSDYVFGPSDSTGSYTYGTWLNVEITLEWLSNPDAVRIVTYLDGVEHLSWTDYGDTSKHPNNTPFMWACLPGFRSDNGDFDLDYMIVESLHGGDPVPMEVEATLFEEGFLTGTGNFTAESSTNNTTNVRRETTIDPNGALHYTTVAAGSNRVKSAHFTGHKVNEPLTLTAEVSHNDTVARNVIFQIFETTSTGSYLSIISSTAETISPGSTLKTITRQLTPTNADAAAIKALVQFMSMEAAKDSYLGHIKVTKTINSAETTSFMVEDSDPTYTGTWSQGVGERYTSSAGADLKFVFTGTSFTLVGTKDAHHGILGIEIDGNLRYTLDQYSAARVPNTVLWTSPTLNNSQHTVRLYYTGLKHASSTGTTVTFDAASVESTAGDPYPANDTPVESNAINEEWTTDQTLTTTSSPWALESNGNGTGVASGGIFTISTYDYYNRIYRTDRRYGGPGHPIIIRARKRLVGANRGIYNDTISSASTWFRVPKDGVDKDNYKNAYSGTGVSSSIIRDGTAHLGRCEVTRYDGIEKKYQPGLVSKNLGYTPGTWIDVTIRAEWLSTDNWKYTIWHSPGHDMSVTPVYSWEGYTPKQNEPGWIVFRTDWVTAEYEYFRLQEL